MRRNPTAYTVDLFFVLRTGFSKQTREANFMLNMRQKDSYFNSSL